MTSFLCAAEPLCSRAGGGVFAEPRGEPLEARDAGRTRPPTAPPLWDLRSNLTSETGFGLWTRHGRERLDVKLELTENKTN